MQITKIIQAVMLMILVALAASCVIGKEYSQRVFGRRVVVEKDSSRSVRFLQTDDRTDSINMISAVSKPVLTDSSLSDKPEIIIERPATPVPEPVVKTGKPGEIRTKRTRQ